MINDARALSLLIPVAAANVLTGKCFAPFNKVISETSFDW